MDFLKNPEIAISMLNIKYIAGNIWRNIKMLQAEYVIPKHEANHRITSQQTLNKVVII